MLIEFTLYYIDTTMVHRISSVYYIIACSLLDLLVGEFLITPWCKQFNVQVYYAVDLFSLHT